MLREERVVYESYEREASTGRTRASPNELGALCRVRGASLRPLSRYRGVADCALEREPDEFDIWL